MSTKNPRSSTVQSGQGFTIIPFGGATVVEQKSVQVGGAVITTIRYSDGTVVDLIASGAEMRFECNRVYEVDEIKREIRIKAP